MASHYQIIFVGNMLLLVVLMKTVGGKLAPTNLAWWNTPLLVEIPNKHRPAWANLLFHEIGFFLFTILLWQALAGLAPIDSHWEKVLCGLLVWTITEWMGATLIILYQRPARTPMIHDQPWRAASLAEFWGKRWNLWVGSWLAQTARQVSRSWKGQMWGAFALSGALHELMFNLPYHLATGKPHYGGMMAFFMLQPLGLWLDKSLSGLPPLVRRLFGWGWLVATCSLFVDKPFLHFFGLDR